MREEFTATRDLTPMSDLDHIWDYECHLAKCRHHTLELVEVREEVRVRAVLDTAEAAATGARVMADNMAADLRGRRAGAHCGTIWRWSDDDKDYDLWGQG